MIRFFPLFQIRDEVFPEIRCSHPRQTAAMKPDLGVDQNQQYLIKHKTNRKADRTAKKGNFITQAQDFFLVKSQPHRLHPYEGTL